MDNISFSIPILLHILDLFGVMVFAVTGALKAIQYKMDMVGVIILASSTGLAGGLIRDLLLDRLPPKIMLDPYYLTIAVVSGIIVFFLHPFFKERENLFLKFDAIGLGVFTIIGSSIAYEMLGLNFLAMSLAGIFTAIGGGIVRDVFVKEIPLVFIKELYASASFLGIIIFFILLYFEFNYYISMVFCIVFITLFRLLAIRYNWNLPTKIEFKKRTR
ncbi:MAG TPA: trimeric intracellular cation channel family protein [Nitrososphaeraceae archaeon]|nr:trimeric intracellular cation channel family protein [Nitrososphaeraceae archaeon]